MPEKNQEHRRWWQEPMLWLIIALPLSSVIAGFITAWLAASDPDPLVKDDYQKKGFVLQQSEARAAQAAAVALAATIEAQQTGITVRLSGRLESYPERLILTLVHPTREEQDRSLTLEASAPGVYASALPPLSVGRRQLILEPEDRHWRLDGQWEAPFLGRITLVSAAGAASPGP